MNAYLTLFLIMIVTFAAIALASNFEPLWKRFIAWRLRREYRNRKRPRRFADFHVESNLASVLKVTQ